VALAVAGSGRTLVRTTDVGGHPYRIETVPLRPTGALQVARELQPTEDTLASLRHRYALISALVALLGAFLGWLAAGWLTRPVARLTAAAEHVASTGELDASVETNGRDETSRLAQAFGSMLAALRESRTRQRQLVQDAGHELRTPVTSIRTNVDVLRRHPDIEPADRVAILDEVNAELTHVTTMVDELVLLASGDSDGDEAPGPVQLDRVIAMVAERARRRQNRPITVEVAPLVVQGSARGLERAVSNLLDNAGKFSPPGAPIEVSLVAGRLSVRDHGPGISEVDLPHVFDRFYRSATSRTAPGSGLGLAIVDQVVRAHGGTPFAGNHPGGGAVVGFDLGPGEAR
jgi:two-component system sensor histidine kinase MprB